MMRQLGRRMYHKLCTVVQSQHKNLYEIKITVNEQLLHKNSVPCVDIHINFEEILWCDHGNFEEQNEVMESFTIIINYCIITILYN